MSDGNIPAPRPLKWFEKTGVSLELGWDVFPAGHGLKNWLFQSEGAFVREYRGYRVFWLRGWVRLLGLFLGAGVFLRGDKL